MEISYGFAKVSVMKTDQSMCVACSRSHRCNTTGPDGKGSLCYRCYMWYIRRRLRLYQDKTNGKLSAYGKVGDVPVVVKSFKVLGTKFRDRKRPDVRACTKFEFQSLPLPTKLCERRYMESQMINTFTSNQPQRMTNDVLVKIGDTSIAYLSFRPQTHSSFTLVTPRMQ